MCCTELQIEAHLVVTFLEDFESSHFIRSDCSSFSDETGQTIRLTARTIAIPKMEAG